MSEIIIIAMSDLYNLSSRDKILQSDWSLISILFKSNKSVVPQAEMTLKMSPTT